LTFTYPYFSLILKVFGENCVKLSLLNSFFLILALIGTSPSAFTYTPSNTFYLFLNGNSNSNSASSGFSGLGIKSEIAHPSTKSLIGLLLSIYVLNLLVTV